MIATDPTRSKWRQVKLGEAIEIAQGGFASGERSETGVIQLRMNNVTTRGSFDWSSCIRVPANPDTVAQYQLQTGDVLFNNTNSTELVGKSACFQGFDEPVVFSNHFTRVRTKKELLEPQFLSFWLQHQWQTGLFAEICNRWIGQSAVQRDKLLALDISLPPVDTQERIAAILNEQMAAVEKARAAAELQAGELDAMADWIVRDVFLSKEVALAPLRPFRSLCLTDGQYGTSEKAGGAADGITVLRMGNLIEGRIDWTNLVFIEMSAADRAKYHLAKGDLLFNRTNSAELVGKTAVFQAEREAVFASYLIRFKLDPLLADPEFVAAYINSRYGREFITGHMTRAIGQVNISASTMHKMPIPTPDLRIQRRLAELIGSRRQAVESIRRIAAVRDDAIGALGPAFLRRAFSGEL